PSARSADRSRRPTRRHCRVHPVLPGAHTAHTTIERMTMPTGKVKFYADLKGYGFIAPDDGSADIFVHASQAKRAGYAGLAADQRIKYEVGTNDRNDRPMAINLELLPPIISPV